MSTLVTRYLPRAAKAIQKVTGEDEMTVLGYCIGGALATCFAALHPEMTRNLILLTAPIDFSDAGQFGRMTARETFPLDSVTDTFPIVPGQMPDIGTKLLDPKASYVGTYRQLWDKLADPNFDVRGWQAMYRWVNESVPFAGAAFHQWIVEFYQENRLATDTLEMDGRPVRLADIRCPVLNIAASRDRDRAPTDDKCHHPSSQQRGRVRDRHRGRPRRDRRGPDGEPESLAEGRRLAQQPRLNRESKPSRRPSALAARRGADPRGPGVRPMPPAGSASG